MAPHNNTGVTPSLAQNGVDEEPTIAQLISQVYTVAPASDRCRILEQLMRPLGVLSLVAVANGVFAKLWFRSGWRDLHLKPDDTEVVQASDVTSLVNFVQQANFETIDGLSQVLSTSPVLGGSAAAMLLVTLLMRHAQSLHSTKLPD